MSAQNDDLFLSSLDGITPTGTTFKEPESAPSLIAHQADPALSQEEKELLNYSPSPVDGLSSSISLSSDIIPARAGRQAEKKESVTTAVDDGASPGTEPQSAKLRIAVKALKAMEHSLQNVIRLLEEDGIALPASMQSPNPASLGASAFLREEESHRYAGEGRVLEGVFDGQNMVGSDGKFYPVPPNYASKSKLVEGDMLKLTITGKGTFIYKQIGPIERGRVVGELGFDQTIGEYYATEGVRRWSILKASVTYFKGEAGDEVVLLIPQGAPSKWAAVENIMKNDPLA